jgi:hypothetical protein
MQRSISHQKPLVIIGYILLFILYSSLGSIYPFLPPLLALLFHIYANAMKREDTLALFIVFFCLLIFEANYGFFFLSSIIYFYIQYKLFIPKIDQLVSCNICKKIAIIILTYMGYFLFLSLFANVFLLETPSMNYYIVFYIIIEFLIVSIL